MCIQHNHVFFILHFPIILSYSIVPYTSRMEAIENKHIKIWKGVPLSKSDHGWSQQSVEVGNGSLWLVQKAIVLSRSSPLGK